MRPSVTLTWLGSAAALFALFIAGCKYSSLAGALPGPASAPTFKPGVVTESAVPTANATPFGITTGPDGNIWFAELNGDKIARVVPGLFPGAGAFTECQIPTAAAGPVDVTSVNGNPDVWFDEFGANKIGKVVPSTCAISEFPTGGPGSQPLGLTADHSGVLWFAESAGTAAIVKMTTSGFPTPYAIGLGGSQPVDVAIAPDNTVWYLDLGRNSVGHLTFPGGSPSVADFALPTASAEPQFMTVGPDGNLWLTETGIVSGTGCRIAKVALGVIPPTITEYQMQFAQPLPDGDFCLGIANAGGDLWFAEADSGAIGRITTTGVVTEFSIPGAGTTAIDVTDGPDGNLWFTDGAIDPSVVGVGTNQIGQVKIGLVPAFSIHRTYKAKATTTRMPLLTKHGVPIRR